MIGHVAVLMALNSLAIDIMLPSLPYMGKALGVVSENERQFIFSAYMLGYGMGGIVFGPLSDCYGRRAPLLAGLGLYVIAAAAAMFSPTFTAVLALRFAQGIGAASTRVIATSIVRDRFSGNAMVEVMSMAFMLFMAIPILAPGLGQTLLYFGPWQVIFAFMAVFGLGVALWTALRLPETLPPERRRSIGPGAVLERFRIVTTHRAAFAYGLAGTSMFAALFGFLNSAQ